MARLMTRPPALSEQVWLPEQAQKQHAAMPLAPAPEAVRERTYNCHSLDFRDWHTRPIPSQKSKLQRFSPKTPCPRHATILPVHLGRLRLACNLIQEAFVLNYYEAIAVDDRASRLEVFQRLVHALPGNTQHICQIFLADKGRDTGTRVSGTPI